MQSTGDKFDSRLLLLARLNERRELMRKNIQRPMILVLPSGFQRQVRETAPDLWSIREFSMEPASEISRTEPSDPPAGNASFPGTLKLLFCMRLGADWRFLADFLEIPLHDQRRFAIGDEGRAIWAWLENRGSLSRLPDALQSIGRADLADEFYVLGRQSFEN